MKRGLNGTIAITVSLFIAFNSAQADWQPGGIKQIWIAGSDGGSCVSASTDSISIAVARMRANRNDSFWRNETDVALENQLQASGSPSGTFNYSQIYKQNISQFPGDVIDIPVIDIVGGIIPLHIGTSDKLTLIREIQLDTYEDQTRSPSDATKALLTLQQVASQFPPTPFSAEMKMASDMSSVLVGNLIDTSQQDQQTLPFGRIGKTISKTGTNCQSNNLWTGIYVDIKQFDGSENDGFLDFSREDHCFIADDSNGQFAIKFGTIAPATPGIPKGVSQKSQIPVACAATHTLNNPYVALRVEIEDVDATGSVTRDAKFKTATAENADIRTLQMNLVASFSRSPRSGAIAAIRPADVSSYVNRLTQKKVSSELGTRPDGVSTRRWSAIDNMISLRAEKLARCHDMHIEQKQCFTLKPPAPVKLSPKAHK